VPASAGPVATPILNAGFHFSDILKVQVNNLAARIAPKTSAALVHWYITLDTTSSDLGEVRLDKGAFVSVELGPVPIGNTVWYLVWPATSTQPRTEGTNWYHVAPPKGQSVPAWVAASVGDAKYMTFAKRPTTAEIEAVQTIGLNLAGRGNYRSDPMPRHDAFLLTWAAASTSATACTFKVELVPDDLDFDPLVAVSTSTTTVKVAALEGVPLLWSVATKSTWATFTLDVTSTCNWAVRLERLEHD
jgi:hypothetical protein